MDKPLYNGSVLWIILTFGLCIYFLRQGREEFFDAQFKEVNFKNLIILIVVSKIVFYFIKWWGIIILMSFKFIISKMGEGGSVVNPRTDFFPVYGPDGKDLHK